MRKEKFTGASFNELNTSQTEFVYLIWFKLIQIPDYLRAQIKVPFPLHM